MNNAEWGALESVVFCACSNVDLNKDPSVDFEGKFCIEQYRYRHKADMDARTEFEHDEDDFYPSSRTTASLLEDLR